MTREEPPDAGISPPPPPAVTDDAQELLAYVRDRDVKCPLCGYNLRALAIPRCPECGQGLKLAVGLTDVRLKAWIVCTASSCLSAGVGLVFLFIFIRNGGAPRIPATEQAISFYSFPTMIPLAALFLFCRRAFLRRSEASQASLAFLTLVLVILHFGILFSWVR